MKCLATSEAMKEILLAGDTNRLVAELTFAARRDGDRFGGKTNDACPWLGFYFCL